MVVPGWEPTKGGRPAIMTLSILAGRRATEGDELYYIGSFHCNDHMHGCAFTSLERGHMIGSILFRIEVRKLDRI